MKKLNKIIALLMSTALVFVSFMSYAPKAQAKTLSDLRGEYSDIEDKVAESEQKVKELESQQADQSKIVSALNVQLQKLNQERENITAQKDLITEDIDATEKKISSLNSEIAKLDAEIAAKDQEIKDTVKLFCDRMRANYMAGETSVLEIFTSSSDMSSFLNRLEMFKRVTESDQDLVDKLNKEIASIEKMQKELEVKKAALQKEKTELEAKRSDLQSTEDTLTANQNVIKQKTEEVETKLNALNAQTKELRVSIDEYNSEMSRLDKEIKEAIRKANQSSSGSSGGSSSGGSNAGSMNSNVSSSGWAWPLPYDGVYLTSYYGYRYHPLDGDWRYHSGIDVSMSGAYGKNIVATRAGTVILSSLESESGTGYGNYIIIDHGDGYTSLYGHCSALLVSQGQRVSRGQIIARVGSTGWSTGPHLHFEVRYNGETVDPLDYVNMP